MLIRSVTVQFSFHYLKFSWRYTNGNMFGMFLFAFWTIWTLKCEVVNFVDFELACIPVRLFKYLDMPILFIAREPCMLTREHAQCDVTRFAYDANQVTMMSPAFAFHSCQVETRWHDIIGAHIVRDMILLVVSFFAKE